MSFISFFQFLFRGVAFIKRRSYYVWAVGNGLKVGDDTLFIGDQSFGSEPYLIEIGSQCLITDGVRFITHDGSIQVPLIKKGSSIAEVYSKRSTFGRVKIDDNVFIGVGSIILPNTKISSNSIIAAGSVVKGEFEEGMVIGGNPAKTICTIDDYLLRNEGDIITFSGVDNRKERILKLYN